MVLAGIAWFAGTFVPAAVFWHRGPLVHLLLSHPTGRLRRRRTAAVVMAVYVVGLIRPIMQNDIVVVIGAALIGVSAVDVFVRNTGRPRRVGVPALTVALAYVSVLAAGAVQRRAGCDAGSPIE